MYVCVQRQVCLFMCTFKCLLKCAFGLLFRITQCLMLSMNLITVSAAFICIISSTFFLFMLLLFFSAPWVLELEVFCLFDMFYSFNFKQTPIFGRCAFRCDFECFLVCCVRNALFSYGDRCFVFERKKEMIIVTKTKQQQKIIIICSRRLKWLAEITTGMGMNEKKHASTHHLRCPL